jgi:phosphoribosylformylglycinamidine cyclo-ligase
MPRAAAPVPKNTPLTYAAAGVSTEAGDRVVDLIDSVVKRTHGPRVLGPTGGFAGMFRLDYNEKLFKRNYRDPVLIGCTDGVGTKVKLAAQLGIHHTVGIDCVAMNVNDLIVQGGEPLFFLDYLGLHKVVPEQTAQIVQGVARGCEIAGCALLGGETAEMPDIYARGDFDIAGFAVGVVELERAIDPMRVEKGDVVIGLASSGVHSNGYALVRKIIGRARLRLDRAYPDLSAASFSGELRPQAPGLLDRLDEGTLGRVLMEPTRIYARPIVRLLQQYTVKKVVSGMAHITGSGLPGNLCRALPPDLDAAIDTGSWVPHPVFAFLQKHGSIERSEMWSVFNMGIGYTLIVRPTFADSIVRQLRRAGEAAAIIGEVVRGHGDVRLA